MSRANQAIRFLVATKLVKVDMLTGNLKVEDPAAEITIKAGGYLTIQTFINRRRVRVFVHRIIAYLKYGDAAFDENLEVHHKNLNPKDNHPDNLVLLTKEEHERIHREIRDARKSQ